MRVRQAISHRAIVLGALLILVGASAQAQQPTSAQADAIRASCRSDFMANCSGVQPGGKDALQCLRHNLGKLSPACKSAVAATMKPPANAARPPAAAPALPTPKSAVAPPAAPPPPAPTVAPLKLRPFILPQRRIAILGVCGTDVTRLCHGVPPGHERVLECLAAHPADLTGDCYAALERVSVRR